MFLPNLTPSLWMVGDYWLRASVSSPVRLGLCLGCEGGDFQSWGRHAVSTGESKCREALFPTYQGGHVLGEGDALVATELRAPPPSPVDGGPGVGLRCCGGNRILDNPKFSFCFSVLGLCRWPQSRLFASFLLSPSGKEIKNKPQPSPLKSFLDFLFTQGLRQKPFPVPSSP